ncbi:hypothetical protein [Endozoicomonas sp. 2B-B]
MLDDNISPANLMVVTFTVLKIVKQARVNRIDAEALNKSAQLSVSELESLLPRTDDSVTEVRVRLLVPSKVAMNELGDAIHHSLAL